MSKGLKISASLMDSLPSILDLNDDCLLKVFGNLNVMDLCAVNYTCKRFRQLSEYSFRMQYSFKPVLFQQQDTRRLGRLKLVLKAFGKYINKLIICCNQRNSYLQRILQEIGTYCGRNLKEVELKRISLDNINKSTWETLLSNVERLSISYCPGKATSFYDCVNSCSSLKELEVTEQSDVLLFNFEFRKCQHRFQSLILKKSRNNCYTLKFVQRLFNLKKLRVTDYYFAMEWLIDGILKYSRDIEEIAIQMLTFSDNLQRALPRLSELEKLKRLEFNCGGIIITPLIYLLAERNIMEYFSISCTELNYGLCEAFSKMHSLKTLKLISMKKEYNKFTKILSGQLLELERFYVVGSDVFTLTDAIEMIESLPNLMCSVVKNRKRKYWNQLITIYLDQSVLNAAIKEIPQQMREENSGYIKLLSTRRSEIRNEDFIVDYGNIIRIDRQEMHLRNVPRYYLELFARNFPCG